jgi:hypothetical protein
MYVSALMMFHVCCALLSEVFDILISATVTYIVTLVIVTIEPQTSITFYNFQSAFTEYGLFDVS